MRIAIKTPFRTAKFVGLEKYLYIFLTILIFC